MHEHFKGPNFNLGYPKNLTICMYILFLDGYAIHLYDNN
jgi:hypothetical protein